MSKKNLQPSLEVQILQLAADVATLRHAVCTLIAWIGASAGSPLSMNDCRTLIAMAERNSKAE